MNSEIEGRPLDAKRWKMDASRAIGGFYDGLSLGSMKESDSSPGQEHKFTVQVETLRGIKDSGPSPGVGHSFTNAHTFGGIKNSGPGSGQGHNYILGHHNWISFN